MANSFDELTAMIKKLILDTTRYNVPRLGKISKVNDELKKGRVLVLIPSLGWDTDEKGAWCYPKDKNKLVTPDIGKYVLVEFIDGDRDLPVYSGVATQMKNMLPAAYDGKNTTQVLFENKAQDFAIVFDEENNVYKIGAADESFVKGDTTKPELQKNIDALTQLKADLTAWIPAPGDGGTALKTILTAGFLTKLFADLTNMLSAKIKGE